MAGKLMQMYLTETRHKSVPVWSLRVDWLRDPAEGQTATIDDGRSFIIGAKQFVDMEKVVGLLKRLIEQIEATI